MNPGHWVEVRGATFTMWRYFDVANYVRQITVSRNIPAHQGTWCYMTLVGPWTPMPTVTTLEEAQATALALWRMR